MDTEKILAVVVIDNDCYNILDKEPSIGEMYVDIRKVDTIENDIICLRAADIIGDNILRQCFCGTCSIAERLTPLKYCKRVRLINYSMN